MKATISVVINTLNEEKNLRRCLESVSWADEIVIVDMHSEDDTVTIAKKYTKRIYSHERTGYVEPARNYAISKATGDWILLIDADEEVSTILAERLQKIASTPSDIAYVAIPRKNIIFGQWIKHTGWWPDHLIRFFKKGSVTWKETIHSVPETTGQGLLLEEKDEAIIHYNYDSVKLFLQKTVLSYAPAEAENLLKKGYVFRHIDIIRFPFQEFLSRYFAREGYKDGFHGLMLSLLMSFYHLVVFAYLWEAQKFSQPVNASMFQKELGTELHKVKKEFIYWKNTVKLEEQKNLFGKLWIKWKRKIGK